MWSAKNPRDQAKLDKEISQLPGLISKLDNDNQAEVLLALKIYYKKLDRIHVLMGGKPGEKRRVGVCETLRVNSPSARQARSDAAKIRQLEVELAKKQGAGGDGAGEAWKKEKEILLGQIHTFREEIQYLKRQIEDISFAREQYTGEPNTEDKDTDTETSKPHSSAKTKPISPVKKRLLASAGFGVAGFFALNAAGMDSVPALGFEIPSYLFCLLAAGILCVMVLYLKTTLKLLAKASAYVFTAVFIDLSVLNLVGVSSVLGVYLPPEFWSIETITFVAELPQTENGAMFLVMMIVTFMMLQLTIKRWSYRFKTIF